ncbi:phosphotransacetylase family protein [Candidatus Neptunichlamydia sp. REUL1]|uniref:phosphotransacetylase family protein n=1 Tax=Candidatus Neptunichlamydia sp. REUL1 TaxID=3064277 RepID=UPI0029305C78|nr:AAA family ATPase [Candidatus Neptunochlamydia sp. REUL1]
MSKKAFFVAATGQHVGKTTTCLGLVSGLLKKHKNVGFIKPIGQEHIEIETGVHVDKDVVLFKDHFDLKQAEATMSPVLFPRGFTRDFLDEKVKEEDLQSKIEESYKTISKSSNATVVEGTGHVGVGSIVNFSNARVASLLGLPMILVASGGLGSAFDALAVNKALCDAEGVRIAGIILNRVHDDKRDMVLTYMEKALADWNIPILGCIPFDPFLSNPTMQDYESLFNATLLTGEEHHMRHFRHMRLVATSLKNYRELILPNQLIITPSNREDIILSTLTKHWDVKIANPQEDLSVGIILTGDAPPRQTILEALKKANIPMLYAPVSSYRAMEMITSYTVKIRKEDKEKINEAVEVVESHIDFDLLLSTL